MTRLEALRLYMDACPYTSDAAELYQAFSFLYQVTRNADSDFDKVVGKGTLYRLMREIALTRPGLIEAMGEESKRCCDNSDEKSEAMIKKWFDEGAVIDFMVLNRQNRDN